MKSKLEVQYNDFPDIFKKAVKVLDTSSVLSDKTKAQDKLRLALQEANKVVKDAVDKRDSLYNAYWGLKARDKD